ncbi:MAG: CHAT domain-containing protein [Acidobacteria bacterium]|nr:CHAT domain-containing protein [Acidobacteriota bacterium]
MRRRFPGAAALLLSLASSLLFGCRTAPHERALAEALQLHQAGSPREALALYEKVTRRAELEGEEALRVRALLGSARVLYESQLDLKEARHRLEEALATARAEKEPKLEADALSSLGIYYWYYDRQRERCLPEFYLPALETYRKLGDRKGLAAALGRIGLVHLAAEDYEAASEALEESRQLYEELDDGLGLSDAHRYLGALYVQLERTDRALDHYRRSLVLADSGDYSLGRRRTEALLAHLHLRRGEYSEAVEVLDRLIEEEPPSSPASRNHLVTRGNATLHLGRPAEAEASYRQALAIEEEGDGADPAFRAQTLTMLAHAQMQGGNLPAAAASLERAESIPIAAKGWGPTVLHTLARADLADRSDHPKEALDRLLEAAEIEHRTFGAARSTFFQTQYRQVFERLVSLLFADVVSQDAAEELAFRFLEQMRFRSFRSAVVQLGAPRPPVAGAHPREREALERIEAASRSAADGASSGGRQELRAAYAAYEDQLLLGELSASRYRRLQGLRPLELAEVQRSLAPGDALVEYVLAGERVFALALTHQTLESAVLPVSATDLYAKVKLFRRLVFEGEATDDDAWRALAGDLGRILIEPVEATGALAMATRLVLVPMGSLHGLPFAALADREGRLLAERYTLLRSPSATLWARPAERSSEDPSRKELDPLLTFGLRQATGSELPPLELAEQEARAVAAVFSGSVFVARAASEASFKALAPGARRLHLAAHGLAEPRLPLHARIRLEDGGGEDGELTVREILDLELSAELVSLSACETALSPGATGAPLLEVDRLGFVEAFLQAGAGNVLASLVPVSDAGTAVFMETFYVHLRSLSIPEALAATQRQMLTGRLRTPGNDELDLRHPRYWAPFVLVSRGEGVRSGDAILSFASD